MIFNKTFNRGATMIVQHHDSTHVENNLLRQIKIKETQIKIAQEFNMFHVAEALQSQLTNLHSQLSELPDPQFEALMSLLDDGNL